MNIKEYAKINKIGISSSSGRRYFEIQFDDNNVKRVYLMLHKDLLLSRVFVVNDDNKPVKLSKDNLVLLDWIDCSMCDITYDVRAFYKDIIYYARDIILIVNDKDYKYIAEKVSFDEVEE